MTPDETAGYIRHHLEHAGRTADLFTDDAVTQIHQAARGKPRTVNNICHRRPDRHRQHRQDLVDHDLRPRRHRRGHRDRLSITATP